ncbi:hypothetical protein ACQPW3_27185 [Actinosynnema sp. CA-248983]
MNERGALCLRLALIAATPLGASVGLALGGTPEQAVLTGLLSGALWFGGLVGLAGWVRVRRVHERSGHWVLTLVAAGLPDQDVDRWLEEMRAQLGELRERPHEHRRMLVDLAVHAPSNWLEAWRNRRLRRRAHLLRGGELHLMRHLAFVLAPDGDNTTSADRLNALGLTRLQVRRPAKHVPALALSRRLLSTTSVHLAPAREHARTLLESREQAHLIIRNRLRDPHTADDETARAELTRLRTKAHEEGIHLRTALLEARHDTNTTPPPAS